MTEPLTDTECFELLEGLRIWLEVHPLQRCPITGDAFGDELCPTDLLIVRRG